MPIKQVSKTKVFDALVGALKEREEANDTRKAVVREFNRLNTQACNSFKSFLQQENLPTGTKVSIEGIEYSWEVTEAEVIDPRKWHKLWQDKQITEDQYFDGIKVGKTDAKLIIGEDQVLNISSVQKGKTADIRTDDSNAGRNKGIQVTTPPVVVMKLPEKVQTSAPSVRGVASPMPVRKILVGKK